METSNALKEGIIEKCEDCVAVNFKGVWKNEPDWKVSLLAMFLPPAQREVRCGSCDAKRERLSY